MIVTEVSSARLEWSLRRNRNLNKGKIHGMIPFRPHGLAQATDGLTVPTPSRSPGQSVSLNKESAFAESRQRNVSRPSVVSLLAPYNEINVVG